ncbi:HesB/IscA family protein [Brevibacillus dissolubilis]|uniref:HesB/IscA family protein n=1 Tax=Brevibacillus dissolubilis TaxID=1844116 RepID=UPI0011165ABF|nr:iron-sulfur cluster biosynthesis family protein [Brevibacillus dissolubilis]
MLTITPLAAARLHMLIQQEPDADVLGISVQVVTTGCSSFSYNITMTERGPRDECEEIAGLSLFYQITDIPLIQGLVIDFDKETGRFHIFNPNPPAASCPIG